MDRFSGNVTGHNTMVSKSKFAFYCLDKSSKKGAVRNTCVRVLKEHNLLLSACHRKLVPACFLP